MLTQAIENSIMFRTVIVVFVYCYLISMHIGSTAVVPTCSTKDTCNDIWKAPNVSDCINGICQCTGGAVFVSKNNTCECEDGYIIGSTKCLPVTRALYEACDEDSQCSKLGDLAVCDNYQCYCRHGATPVNGKCQSKKYIGENCSSSEECQHIKNSVCRDNICACGGGQVPNSDAKSCLPLLKNFWSACVNDVQCHYSFGEGSRCLTKCVCRNEYHIVNDSLCIKTKGLGQVCSSDYDCYLEPDIHGETIRCQSGICTCKSGYHSSSDNYECLQDTGGSVSLAPMSYLLQILIVCLTYKACQFFLNNC